MRHDNDALNDPFITEGESLRARAGTSVSGIQVSGVQVSGIQVKEDFYLFFLQVSTCVSLPDFKRQQMAFVMINS